MERIYCPSREMEEAELANFAGSPEARLAPHEIASRYAARASEAEAATFAMLGIEPVRDDHYWIHGMRYTSAGDAIAEARRGIAQ